MQVQHHRAAAVRVPPKLRADKRFRTEQGAGALLGVIRELRSASRRDLIAATGLARGTVEGRVERLLAAGWIVEREDGATTGRPPRVLSFNGAGAYVLCLDIDSRQTRIGVADLNCSIVTSAVLDRDITLGPGRVLGDAASALVKLMSNAGIDPGLVMGVGVGVPSPVALSGQMARPPAPGVSALASAWESLNIAHEILAFIPAMGIREVPVAVDKDANLMALGEWRRSFPSVHDLIVVKVGLHLSCGIVANQGILRGSTGLAGDLEHIPDPDSDVTCRCGQPGCLEATSSGDAILRQLGDPSVHDGAGIVARLQDGDKHARLLVRQAGTRIGRVLAAAMSVLNPDLVVVGGSLAKGNDVLVEAVHHSAMNRVHPLTATTTRIVTAGIHTDAGLVGAAHLVLGLVTEPAAVDAALAEGLVLNRAHER